MTQRNAPPVEHQSASVMETRLEQLKALFPEAVNEDGIDFDALKVLLGVVSGGTAKERYSFTWAGKQDAILSLQTRSKAALKPAPSESVNWDSTQNLFIEGDNLEVLKLLYKSYYGRVKMIYIDPPYNTENDFIYPDDYTDSMGNYLRLTGQVDDDGRAKSSKLEVSGRKHSKWLSMMYPRLFVARQLLRNDGVIFVSIDEHEMHNLRLLMNEIFGEENFVSCFVWQKRKGGGNDSNFIAYDHEYILMFVKDKTRLKKIFKDHDVEYAQRYNEQDEIGHFYWDTFRRKAGKQYYPIICPDESVLQYDKNGNPISWLRSEKRFHADIKAGEIKFVEINDSWSVQFKQRKPEGVKPRSLLLGDGLNSDGSAEILQFFGNNVFDTPKPVKLIHSLLEIGTETDEEDIILDFFAGSGTTADAILQLNREDGGNRRFILVQLPEVTSNPDYPTIADITKERIRRVINQMKAQEVGKLNGFEARADEDLGFRAFKFDVSPMRQWEDLPADTSVEEYARQLTLFVQDPLLAGWTVEDVIAEVALKEVGYNLSYRLETVTSVQGQTVYKISDDEREQHFYICLDDQLDWDALQPLVRTLTREDLFVFRDSAITDTVVANLSLTCRIKSL